MFPQRIYLQGGLRSLSAVLEMVFPRYLNEVEVPNPGTLIGSRTILTLAVCLGLGPSVFPFVDGCLITKCHGPSDVFGWRGSKVTFESVPAGFGFWVWVCQVLCPSPWRTLQRWKGLTMPHSCKNNEMIWPLVSCPTCFLYGKQSDGVVTAASPLIQGQSAAVPRVQPLPFGRAHGHRSLSK